MNNWYIGQKIVCIKSSSQANIKKGQIFTIKKLKSGYCKCSKILIDVEVTWINSEEHSICITCNSRDSEPCNYIHWLNENRFIPLDELSEQEENIMSELIKETLFQSITK